MNEWTTDLRQAKPGWLVEQDCVGVVPVGKHFETYEVTKRGTVISCAEFTFLVSISTPLGEDELWRLGYTDTKVRVRAPDG